MNPNYYFVAQRANHRCEYCQAPEVIFNVNFEVDRIIPISKNGTDQEQNLALSCRICNLRKLDHTHVFDSVSQEQIRLFNPRIDLWDDHFIVANEPPLILEGKTAIGLVTIERLDMNSRLQIRAREIWRNLGIY
ncbi:MAG TPA: HNH endonuclease signature motif containing protein [Allocoleopsis sp.]